MAPPHPRRSAPRWLLLCALAAALLGLAAAGRTQKLTVSSCDELAAAAAFFGYATVNATRVTSLDITLACNGTFTGCNDTILFNATSFSPGSVSIGADRKCRKGDARPLLSLANRSSADYPAVLAFDITYLGNWTLYHITTLEVELSDLRITGLVPGSVDAQAGVSTRGNSVVMSASNVEFSDCKGDFGGAVTMFDHAKEFTIERSNFTRITGGSAGAVYVEAFHRNSAITDCAFRDVSGLVSGAVAATGAEDSQCSLSLRRSTFSNTTATLFASAVLFGAPRPSLDISRADFTAAAATNKTLVCVAGPDNSTVKINAAGAKGIAPKKQPWPANGGCLAMVLQA